MSRIVKFNGPLLVMWFCHRAAHSARLGGTQNYRLSHKLVVPTRVELVTFTLSRCCSTTELRNYKWSGWEDSNLQPPTSKAGRLRRLTIHPDKFGGRMVESNSNRFRSPSVFKTVQGPALITFRDWCSDTDSNRDNLITKQV